MNEWVSPRNVLVKLGWITGSIGEKTKQKALVLAFTSFHGIKPLTMTNLKLHMRCHGGAPLELAVGNPLASAGDIRDAGLIPGLGRSPGAGHGNPLQYSCLDNSKDRVAWWATVHVVTKSQTQLKQLSMRTWDIAACSPGAQDSLQWVAGTALTCHCYPPWYACSLSRRHLLNQKAVCSIFELFSLLPDSYIKYKWLTSSLEKKDSSFSRAEDQN